ILFNHESPIRGETFVSRKITRAASRIALGMQNTVFLGNLDARRDWGHAKDYVEAMWLMLQQETPDDYVIATGITTTVRDLVKMAFAEVDITLDFRGEGEKEEGFVVSCSNPDFQVAQGKTVVQIDPEDHRQTEVDLLIGDAAKCKEKLNWQPKYDLPALVKEMMEADVALFRKEKYLKDGE